MGLTLQDTKSQPQRHPTHTQPNNWPILGSQVTGLIHTLVRLEGAVNLLEADRAFKLEPLGRKGK